MSEEQFDEIPEEMEAEDSLSSDDDLEDDNDLNGGAQKKKFMKLIYSCPGFGFWFLIFKVIFDDFFQTKVGRRKPILELRKIIKIKSSQRMWDFNFKCCKHKQVLTK